MAVRLVEPPSFTATDLASFAPLTAVDIAEQADSASLSRGKGYQRSRHIYNTVRRGATLRARCHGSSGGPYLVEATLAPASRPKMRNPASYACNCPRGDFCKHIVALLLTWIEQPEVFEVRPAIPELLASKTKEELIALIEVILRENPDLEDLLNLPIVAAGVASDEAVDEAAIRRQITAALRDDGGFGGGYSRGHYSRGHDYDEYNEGDDASYVASKLDRLVTFADAYVAGGFWRNALVVSAALVEELTPQLDSLQDEEGELSLLLSRTDQNLAACLAAQDGLPAEQRLTGAERQRLIDAILTIWQADIDAGGLDLSDGGPEAIATFASPEEQLRVRDELRPMLVAPAVNGDQYQWQNRAVIWLLSLLKGDAGLTPEELLTEYRNAELWTEAAEMLLEMERIDEAIALASRRIMLPTPLLAFADRLIAMAEPPRIEQAITLVDDRLWEREGQKVHEDQMLREWLEKRYAEHGQPKKALALAQSRFKVSPTTTTYNAVREAARLPGLRADLWPDLRPELIATLRKDNQRYTLIDIHLAEGEIAEAIAELKQAGKKGETFQDAHGDRWPTSTEGTSSRVAAAAEAHFPNEAISIYQQLAERKIANRGRPSYQQAATYLVRVLRLMEGNGRAADWTTFIADLRQRHKTLRSLKEELDSLGLE